MTFCSRLPGESLPLHDQQGGPISTSTWVYGCQCQGHHVVSPDLTCACRLPLQSIDVRSGACSDVVGPRRGASAKDESITYDVMSDQEWEPEDEDGEDIMVRRSHLAPSFVLSAATSRWQQIVRMAKASLL